MYLQCSYSLLIQESTGSYNLHGLKLDLGVGSGLKLDLGVGSGI